MSVRWQWKCCGIASGNFRSYRKYLRSWSAHRRWYHYGPDCGRSRYSYGFTPYP